AQFFASDQAVQHLRASKTMTLPEHGRHVLQQQSFARYVDIEADIADIEQFANGIHRFGRLTGQRSLSLGPSGYRTGSKFCDVGRRSSSLAFTVLLLYVFFLLRDKDGIGALIEVDDLGIPTPGDEGLQELGGLIV